MNDRERILRAVRAARGVSATGEADRAAVRTELARPRRGPRPDLDWEPVPRFREMALAMSSTVEFVASEADVPAAVAGYLGRAGLAPEAVAWPELGGLPWGAAGLRVRTGAASGADEVGITGAFCGVAETGTLVLLSGPGTPAAASLLPDTHVALLRTDRIVRTLEDAWALLRAERDTPPRQVTLVSGPSRSGDIELNITLGVHGPRAVHILLVGRGGCAGGLPG